MRYINQLEHEEIPYLTDLEHPDSEFARNGTIRTAGCGLCCGCMTVDFLGAGPLSLEEAVRLSYDAGANREVGTDMKIFGAALAERFGLGFDMTDDPEKLRDCLHAGGCCIINVGGDREGHIGVFSHGGHYILTDRVENSEFRIWDPSRTPEKFSEPGREAVRTTPEAVYTDPETLLNDTANRSPAFYLFRKK